MGLKNPIVLKTVAALLFTLILLVSPLVTVVVGIFWLVKKILTGWKNIFKPHHGQFLSGLSCLFAADSPYATPRFNASIRLYIKGRLEVEQLRSHVEKVLARIAVTDKTAIKNRPASASTYPELRQYLSTWMGYSIWKDEKNVPISDHIKLLDWQELNAQLNQNKTVSQNSRQFQLTAPPSPLTKEAATSLAYDLNHIPFKKGTSPWEILVCHDVAREEFEFEEEEAKAAGENEEPVTLIFLRLHHLLGDGISAIAMLSQFLDDPTAFQKTNVIFTKKNFQEGQSQCRVNPIIKIFGPLVGLFEYICHGLETAEEGPWVRQPLESTWADRHVLVLSVPYGNVKEIMKVHNGVQFSSVLIAALGAAIRRYMKSHGVVVPEVIHSSVSVAQPREPTRVCNKVTLARVKMPVGLNRRDDLIRTVNEDYLSCIYSRMHQTALMLCSIYGQFPQRLPMVPGSATCASSNLILFHNATTMAGLPVISLAGNGNLPPSIAIVMHTAVYVDRVDVNLGMGKHIFKTQKEARELMGYLESEFRAFRALKNNVICPETTVV